MSNDGGVLTLDRPDASLDVVVCADKFAQSLNHSHGKSARRLLFEELKRLVRGPEDLSYVFERLKRVAESQGQSPGVVRVTTLYVGRLIQEVPQYDGGST